ncbi:MAG: hypothetical protein EOP04_21685, partial [Proteobacteria bacterium]
MELYTIDVKPFKQTFLQNFILLLAATFGSFLLINNGYFILNNFDPQRQYTLPIMIAMVAVAFVYTFYRKKQLEKVFNVSEFYEQVEEYRKVYRLT